MTHWLDIVGVGEGGVADLPTATREIIAAAGTVIGPARLLSTLTPTPVPTPQGGGGGPARTPEVRDEDRSGGSPSPSRGGDRGGGPQTLLEWQPGIPAMLAQLTARRGTPTAILASGDPMWFGIGATLTRHLERDEFDVHPHVSAFQLAAARLHWPLQHVTTLSLHGRPAELLHPHLLPGNRILALTSDAAQFSHIRGLLMARGYGQSRLTVLEHLGGEWEHIESRTAAGFDAAVGNFYVLAIDCVADAGARLLPAVPGLPDDAFVNDGQLTKREVRATTLSKLAPHPGALLWDVGAGCGSIAIEWMRSARDAKAIAFEREGERLQMIAVNAAALGVPGLRIEDGEAPASLTGMPEPDAVFIGGGLDDPALAETCWMALKPGGRLVANAVTIEGEQALFALHDRFGGDLCRIDVASLDSIGGHRAFRPKLPVTQFWVTKP